MDREILQFIDEKLGQGRTCALILIESQDGSAPGAEGAIMALCEDGSSRGTCGGGNLEKMLTQQVMEGMGEARHFPFAFELAKDLGMVCGGSARGYVRYFSQGPELVIFGAGHCSEALVRLLKNQRFAVTVVDEREGYADKEVFRDVRFLNMTPEEAVGQIRFGPSTYLVVATWGHLLDARAYRVCLGREYAFLGGLGSSKKASSVKTALLREGFEEQEILDLHLPVGIDLADGTPEEIAVSILAELLLVKNHRPLQLKKDAAGPWTPPERTRAE